MDTLVSNFHWLISGTKADSMINEELEKSGVVLKMLSLQKIWQWAGYYMYWIASDFRLPILLIRYEDLMEQPEEMMTFIMSFILDVDPQKMAGTLLEHRIKQAVKEERPQ